MKATIVTSRIDWRALGPAALTVVAPAAAYEVGRNLNVLFLWILTAAALAVVCATRRQWIAYGIAMAAAFWAWSPAPMRPPTLFEPAIIDEPRFIASRILEGDQWRYTFSLRDLANHVEECGGMAAIVYVEGGHLSADTVDIEVHGATSEAPRFLKWQQFDRIQFSADLSTASKLSVTLRPRAGGTPSIRVGPEALGSTIYSDAVFLELKNDRCTVLYQTPREVQSARHTP